MADNYIKQVATAALNSIDSILSRWCAGGKRENHEYVALNPKRSDSKLGSFKVNLTTGAFADFALDDVRGGDLVALVAYIDDLPQFAAAKALGAFLGINYQKTDAQNRATNPPNKAGNAITSIAKEPLEWVAILPVPNDAPAPPATHYKHGKPSMQWVYRLGNCVACYVYRFDAKTENERKQFAPLTYCEHVTSKVRKWQWKGLTEPRPLYNLDKIINRPDALVIVCEGEKAADAAAQLLPDFVTTTMLNGAQSPNKTDWQPLNGRDVWLWPDNDEPGNKCMIAITNLLKIAGAASVKTINLKAFENLPDKGDAADLLAAGLTPAAMTALSQKNDFFEAVKPPIKAKQVTQSTEGDSNESRFNLNDGGLYYFGKNDAGNDAPPLWICSKLEVTAVTRDAKNEAWGRLLEFDDLDGVHHTWAMPMDLLGGMGNEYRSTLLAMGLQISTMTKARNLLTQYIQTAKVEARARCVERTGWHDGSFVMPNKTIGNQQEKIIFQSAANTQSTFKQKGKLAAWQDNIAKPCAGNSRLVFAISAAFASPLLDITGMEGGGVHFRGDSSTGKTTALRVASSVWGGLDYLQRWRATDNGLESLAAQHSDCLLVLDELSQVDPKAAGEVAYMLANGSGKVRSIRTGAMRDTASWRLLFLSSGEAGLTEHMALAGRKPKAGQEIRLLDIPADAGRGYGVFDTLHDNIGGAAFSKALTEAVAKNYGVASIAFLAKLVDNLDKINSHVKKLQKEFADKHLADDAGGQANRAALRFALIAAAGEIATVWGITGWQQNEAINAADACFKAWLNQRGGAGNAEERAMLAQVQRFFELHGESRFSDWERPASDSSQHAPKTLNKAGYRKHFDAKDAEGKQIYTGEIYSEGDEKKARDTEFYVFVETFKSEICNGYDYKAVQRLLDKQGALVRPSTGKAYTRTERLPAEGKQNVYRINAKVFGLMAESEADD
jgi:putative DNA primase/helicase